MILRRHTQLHAGAFGGVLLGLDEGWLALPIELPEVHIPLGAIFEML